MQDSSPLPDDEMAASRVKPVRTVDRGVESMFFRKEGTWFDGALIEHDDKVTHQISGLETIEFLGARFHAVDLSTALYAISKAAGHSNFQYVVTPNVDHLVTLFRTRSGAKLGRAFQAADLVACDSRVLSLMAQLSGIDLPAVPGSDLTSAFLEMLKADTKVAVVGGTSDLHAKLHALYPYIAWSYHIPPMGVLHCDKKQAAIRKFVAESAADVTLFAIGAPQSELVCEQIKRSGEARGVALCIGASLEFICGEKSRAPLWLQKARCEWLYRLIAEPKRLGHRYLIKGPAIFLQWFRWSQKQRALPKA